MKHYYWKYRSILRADGVNSFKDHIACDKNSKPILTLIEPMSTDYYYKIIFDANYRALQDVWTEPSIIIKKDIKLLIKYTSEFLDKAMKLIIFT